MMENRMQDAHEPATQHNQDTRTPGEKFADLTKKVIKVPKEQIDAEMKKHVGHRGGHARRLKA